MFLMFHPFLLIVFSFLLRSGLSYLNDNSFGEFGRHIDSSSSTPLVVDVGYALYQGYTDSLNGINVWKGIRFGASTAGSNRWQPPKIPSVNRTSVILCDTFGPQCPQSYNSQGSPRIVGPQGDEDCLFLNIYAPLEAEKLPVVVWIHGGGYGLGNGQQDMSLLMSKNNNSFMAVAIQYRLGAFGFLSSDEVFADGVMNAGLLDQMLALQWIQAYIQSFGGDCTKVTIAGESAGGGSVMLATLAYGGALGTSLFTNAIAASPYLATQHAFNDPLPTEFYNNFAIMAGCGFAQYKFQCLVQASTELLQNASQFVSTTSIWGQWSFLPVTDGTLIQDLPSHQLSAKRVNGLCVLTSNSANDGADFVPANITTEADVVSFLQLRFPSLTEDAVELVLQTYPCSDVSVTSLAPLFATTGDCEPTALNQSSVAVGQQQRANNIYAEATFICPSYWLAEAFCNTTSGQNNDSTSVDDGNGSISRAGYHYQYSLGQALHAQDMSAYFDVAISVSEANFYLAVKHIWGNFIVNNDPSISSLVANGASTLDLATNSAGNWPTFDGNPEDEDNFLMINLNATLVGSRIRNQIEVVDGWNWEGGRGARCEVWRQLGLLVPA